jgi:hypothetical protein
MNFSIWLEYVDKRPIVFSDMDETLVHSFDLDWLHDSIDHKKFAQDVVPDKNVKKIHAKKRDMYIFPRPGVTEFLAAINKFADLVILSHNTKEYADTVVKTFGWSKYVQETHSTGDMKPNSLYKKYNLKNRKWLLIDNLDIHSVEVTSKLRILGLGGTSTNPKDIVNSIVKNADEHFIDVVDWIPTVQKYDDYELPKVLKQIKVKLEI